MKNKIIGVVAEFNPFHNGHKYQIDEIKKNEASLKVAVISGNFTQRGEVSVMDKFEKAKIAILNGYDLVLELPCYYSIQNADVFCEYSVRILNEIGVEVQVFGIEDETLNEIEKIVEMKNSKDYNERLKELLRLGHNYTKANELVLIEKGLNDVYKSNNILAISYINTIKKYNLNIKYEPIKRIKVHYNSNLSKDNIASATFIRNNIKNDEIEYLIVKESYSILRKKNYDINLYNKKIFDIFRYTFTMKSKEEICNIYDFNDSIYNMMNKNIYNTNTYDEFIEKINKRHISLNRIKRLMLNLILNIEKKDVFLGNDLQYIRVLAFNDNGRKYLKSIDSKKIFVNWKDIDKNIVSNLKNIEKRAFLLKNILDGCKEILNAQYIKEV